MPVLAESKTLVMTDDVRLSRTSIVWPTVPLGHEDEAALDALSSILGQLPSQNRLYLAMIYDKPLAASANAFHRTNLLAGEFALSITPQRGQKLDDLIAIADAQVARLKAEGPTAEEVAKVKNVTESASILRLQSVQAKSDFLNSYNVQYGDPLAYKKELKAAYAVTAADVQRVAKKYLLANRVRVDVNPGAKTPRPAEAAGRPLGPGRLAGRRRRRRSATPSTARSSPRSAPTRPSAPRPSSAGSCPTAWKCSSPSGTTCRSSPSTSSSRAAGPGSRPARKGSPRSPATS